MREIIIDKVINNNIISAFEESGTEVVVMGRGIGFKKKPGQTVPSEQAMESNRRMRYCGRLNDFIHMSFNLEHMHYS